MVVLCLWLMITSCDSSRTVAMTNLMCCWKEGGLLATWASIAWLVQKKKHTRSRAYLIFFLSKLQTFCLLLGQAFQVDAKTFLGEKQTRFYSMVLLGMYVFKYCYIDTFFQVFICMLGRTLKLARTSLHGQKIGLWA